MHRFLMATTFALVAVFALATNALAQKPGNSRASGSKAVIGEPVPGDLLAELQKASTAGLSYPAPPEQVALKAISGPRVASGNKVGMLYIGADFCPYCAAQRWVLMLTLLRFGRLDGVIYMRSSPTDVYPNTATFSFNKARYASDYLEFTAVETANREGHRLMKPTEAQNAIFTKFDAPPYTEVFEGIPFVYIDGAYVMTRPMMMPTKLVGKTWHAIGAELSNSQSSLFQSIMPQVNTLTAAVCRLDGGNPDDVCSAPGVTAANGALLALAQGS